MLGHDGQAACVETLASGGTSGLSGSVEGPFTDDNPLYGAYPADDMVVSDRESVTVTVPAAQTTGSDGYDAEAAVSVARTVSNSLDFRTVCGGIKLNFQMQGITKIELESVDGYSLSGTVRIKWDTRNMPVIDEISDAHSILTLNAPDESGFTPRQGLLYLHRALRPLWRIQALHL